MRDMRDALGALGPVDGQNPELNNLTCSMTVIEEGDIVFLTSDGVSDNFDPVVGKFVVAKKPEKPLVNNRAKPTIAKETNRGISACYFLYHFYMNVRRNVGYGNGNTRNDYYVAPLVSLLTSDVADDVT